MSNIPANLRYAATHEWARLEEDGSVTVGVTDHAQEALGDVVFVEPAELDLEVQAGVEVSVVESVKAASDIYSPVSGKIIEVNTNLENSPEKVNEDPYGEGWFFRLEPSDPAELDELLDAEAYAETVESEAH